MTPCTRLHGVVNHEHHKLMFTVANKYHTAIDKLVDNLPHSFQKTIIFMTLAYQIVVICCSMYCMYLCCSMYRLYFCVVLCIFLYFCVVLCIVCIFVLFYVLFVFFCCSMYFLYFCVVLCIVCV